MKQLLTKEKIKVIRDQFFYTIIGLLYPYAQFIETDKDGLTNFNINQFW